MKRGLTAQIDLAALRHNLGVIGRITDNRPVIGVVKADAYGHGAVEISRALVAEGMSCLAVAFTGEGQALRESGITVPIIVLFDRFDIADFFRYRLTPVIQDGTTAAAFSREAASRGLKIAVHVKVDTGMGRVGLRAEGAVEEVLAVAAMEGLVVEGIMSHFSEADLGDRTYAIHQLKLFEEIRREISGRLGRPVPAHIANSAAVLALKEAWLDMIRPGLLLYGYAPFDDNYGLLPVMKVGTKILALRRLAAGCPVSYGRTFTTRRNSVIAVIPVGYADGYDRLFSNNAEMLVRGKRAPVVGRVCMDLTMVDVTEVDDVMEGDEVVLLGGQAGEVINAKELAARINTIPYDILTSLGGRARKVYTAPL